MRMCHFQAQNGPFVLNKTFLVQTIIITFIYLLTLFLVQNCKNILIADPELWRCAIFGPKMVYLPKTICLKKTINIILIYLLAAFIVQNFQKFFPTDPEFWGWAIFGSKMAHFSNENFFSENLLMSLASFIHAYLHAKSDIYLVVKYWRLKNTEISLAKSHFWL